MTTVAEWLSANQDLDRLDRELLICEAAGVTRARLLTAPEAPLPVATRTRLDEWSRRRRAGEPLAYVLGIRGFRDFDLRVTPAVLIPRPETELLVETAIELLAPGQAALDLGTGSGAIAIALALESEATVTGVDVSAAALAVARDNALALAAPVTWLLSDWFDTVSGCFHVIVSNPPYIAAGDSHLEALVHEPALALIGGRDGLDALRHIVDAAPAHLHAGGWLALEHGYDQGSATRELLSARGFSAVETRRDLAGADRVSLGRWT